MLKWQHLFSPTILQRGREYYKMNKVRSLIQDGETYYAAVKGTEEYEVIIRVRDTKVAEMECSCPYAQDGSFCKHMAATLYEISAREIPGIRANKKALAAERDLIQPFTDRQDRTEYRYYAPERFTRNLLIYSDTYEKAQKLIQDGTLHDVSVDEYYADTLSGKVIQASAYPGRAPYPLQLVLDRDRVLRVSCPVSSCGAYFRSCPDRERMEICEHCLALLMLTVGELESHSWWDSTDLPAQQLLRSYWERYRSGARTERPNAEEETAGQRKTVCLSPRLEESETGLDLCFRVGTEEKQYVLKNLEALVEAVQEEGSFALGSRNSLNFAVDCFGERDRKWYVLIRQAVLEKQHHEDADLRRGKLAGVPLYGVLLDDFFDLACGTALEYKTMGGAKKHMEICPDSPGFQLTLRRDVSDDGVFHGVLLEGDVPRLLEGARARYCLEAQRLSRMDGEKQNAFGPLLNQANDGRLTIHVGRRYLTDFYYHILPGLAEQIAVSDADRELIAQYLPPEAGFRFFLDVEDGVPVCRPTAQYGDETDYALTDWLRDDTPGFGFRDQMQETAVLMRTQAFFPQPRENGELASEPDEDSIYRILTEGLDALCEMGEVMSTSRFDALQIRRSVKIQVGISVESSMMELQITSEDVSLEELAQLLKSYRLKKKYHRLKNGDFVDLDDSIGELAELTDTLQLSRKELLAGGASVPAYRALYLDQMLQNTRKMDTTRDRHFRQLVKDFHTVKDSDYEIPEELNRVLRGYQVYGYKWLRTLSACGFGGILADEMGLGKTLQIIAVLLAEKQEGAIGTSLVVCPASLVYNWAEEFRRFAPSLSVCPVEGSQAERQEILSHAGKWDVLISSYDHLKRDIPYYEDRVFLYEILDEAQFIKNQSTASARSVKVVRAKHRFALTGTPIENRLSELWSIFDFLMPGFLYSYETFRRDLERPIIKDGDELTSLRLRRMVSPFVLRRLKTDVLKDLPEKVEEQYVVRFEPEQQKLYDAQVVRMKKLLEEETDESFRKSKIQVLAELTRIRQICCDPLLLFANYTGGSAKLEACMDLVRSAMEGEHRILLFSQFTSMLDLLKARLGEEGIAYYEITGATPKKERLRLVKAFNEGDTPLFLISLRAGGTGLNLTGADIVIHYDPWWNAAAQNQATDRAHRIGQLKPVTVFKLLVKDSIEEKIQQLQEKKQDLAEEILGGEQLSFSSLSREDLLELIGT
ncbi:MAG: SNF2 helicase associated domain-containing protein [Oscillospiraceae bacterium]|nr:SNF2 helicase associated domain-containing protein [Oscillospiraceae bacterium]